MKKRMIVAAVVAASAGFASAELQIGDYGSAKLTNVTGYFSGGAFTWTSTNTSVVANDPDDTVVGNRGSFGTIVSFCLELNRSVGFEPTEYRWEVNNEVLAGGVNTSAGDPLDARTAALYEGFLTGQLTSGDLAWANATNSTDAVRFAALQALIWTLEGEVASGLNGTVSLANAGLDSGDATRNVEIETIANFYLADATNLASFGVGSRVRVLNMTALDGTGDNQDMLILVPMPQAGALAGLGLAGLAIRRRR